MVEMGTEKVKNEMVKPLYELALTRAEDSDPKVREASNQLLLVIVQLVKSRSGTSKSAPMLEMLKLISACATSLPR